MRKDKLRRGCYAVLGCVCITLGLQRIISGEYRTETNLIRSGMTIDGLPAVLIGIAVFLYGCYILYVTFFDNK